jgi:hypothetical protein
MFLIVMVKIVIWLFSVLHFFTITNTTWQNLFF